MIGNRNLYRDSYYLGIGKNMDAETVILTRRSIRKYTKKSISNTLIKHILEAGVNAPSAGNQQPWQFIVIDNRKILDELPNFLPNGKMLKDADKAICICGDLSQEKHSGYWMLDCSAATQNMLLAAHAKGLGACWLGVYPREERVENLKKLFKTPENIVPFSVISLGYPIEKSSKVNRYDESKVHKNIW
jgi:nitroreductase